MGSTNQKVSCEFLAHSNLHLEVFVVKIVNPKLPLIETKGLDTEKANQWTRLDLLCRNRIESAITVSQTKNKSFKIHSKRQVQHIST